MRWLEPTRREEAIQQFKDELLIVSGIERLPDPPNSQSSLDIQEDAVPNQSALDAFFDFAVGQCNFILVQLHSMHSAAVMYCYQRDSYWRGKQECEGHHKRRVQVLYVEPQTNWRVNDVMQWWSNHEANFPHIALLSLIYLAIPASSAPYERVFAQLKLVIGRKRWRMDAGRVERVIFLRCNNFFNA